MEKKNYMSISNKELEQMNLESKIEYFIELSKLSLEKQSKLSTRKNIFHKFVATIAPHLRNYDFEIIGEENIPDNGKALFMCNHSGSHEFFTIHEAFDKIGSNVSAFAASNGLSSAIKYIFEKSSTVLVDRNDKNSIENATLTFASRLSNGEPGALFGEGTWNIHPYRAMQPIKIGGAKIAAIADVPVVPTIIEYLEVPDICDSEKDIYSKCIVKFGEPILISRTDSLISQTDKIYNTLVDMRTSIWKEAGCYRCSIEDVNKDVYLNHTYLKKFDALGGVEYDTIQELRYIYAKNGIPLENEYHINVIGEFVPGVTTKEEGKKYIKTR